MSTKEPRPTGPVSVPGDDTLMRILEGIARFLMWGGIVALVIALAFLLNTIMVFAGGAPPDGAKAQAEANINMFRTLLLAGGLATLVGTAYLFFGEEILGPMQLLAAGALYFAPFYLPSMLGPGSGTPIPQQGLAAIQFTGLVCGIGAILCIVGDVISRVKQRVKQGAKAEQMKYGKGIKAQDDIQNVFMGKCWQLPYCRKFVREKCPIYHSRRTCWKEQVGCMCEESVIQNAMAGKITPSDVVAAAAYIPRTSKLSPKAKFERCKSCVIYNEHQRHKYKLGLAAVILSVLLLYGLGRGFLLNGLSAIMSGVDSAIGAASFREKGSAAAIAREASSGMQIFREILLICLLLMLMAYLLKLIEYLFFKVKI